MMIQCGTCSQKLKISSAAMGKKVRCPKCNAVLRVPERHKPAEGKAPIAAESKQRSIRQENSVATQKKEVVQGSSSIRRRSAEDPRPTRKKKATRSRSAERSERQQPSAPKKKRNVRRRKTRPSARNRDDDLFGGMDDLLAEQNDVIDQYDDENPYAAPKQQGTKSKRRGRSPGRELTVVQKLFSFSGRISRKDFWTLSFAVGLPCGTLPGVILQTNPDIIGSPVFLVFYFGALIVNSVVSLALNVKRLHDRDRSGHMIWMGLIPIFGAIWLFIECGCRAGTPGPNAYGPEPP